VDDAYTQALGTLMSLGQGEQAQAENGMAQQAATSARTAQSDAQLSAANRAGNQELLGTAAGFGMNAAMSNKGPNIPKGFTRQGADIYGLGQQADAFRPNPQAGY
jgi:hypothetical protein